MRGLGQDLLGLLQGGAHRGGHQVFGGHAPRRSGRVKSCSKRQIAVGEDAHQLAVPRVMGTPQMR